MSLVPAWMIKGVLGGLLCSLLWAVHGTAMAKEAEEYQLKAAFIYNFSTFVEWPDEVGGNLGLCVYGHNPFDAYLEPLHGKKVGTRKLKVKHVHESDGLQGCDMVFLSRFSEHLLAGMLASLGDRAVLTIADIPGAARRGVMLNMKTDDKRIVFDANLGQARAHGLHISSKLLRLANEVIQ